MARCAAFARILVTVVLLASWNVTTTHCAFAAALMPAASTVVPVAPDDGCPMHAVKKSEPVHKKKDGCPDFPCCKNLPAAKPGLTTAVLKRIAVPADFIDSIGAAESDSDSPRRIGKTFDTGPPGSNVFVQLVLQRSIPAHAPPAAEA